MASRFQKIVGASALGALSTLDLMYSQHASAVASFSGSTVANPKGGNVQVAITVDGTSGTYRITSIATPVQPTGQNAPYSSLAIPTLTNEALAAQSANITAVSGASQISAAWKSSLSSAIAAAAAGGQPVGGTSITVAPTPTPVPVAPTPTTNTTPPVIPANPSSGVVVPPVATVPAGSAFTPAPIGIPSSVGAPPVYYPLYLPPFVATVTNSNTTINLSTYISQISTAISQLPTRIVDNTLSAINNAKSSLISLQNQLQSANAQMQNQSQSQSPTAGIAAYVDNVNTQLAFVTRQANQSITDYYARVQNAANKYYVDAQAVADKLAADAQVAADKLIADAKAQADKLVADAQARADAITASPAPTVTVTATPKAQAITISLKPGVVIKKTFTCTKPYLGKTVSIVVKDVVIKCPSGYSLKKK